MSDRPQAQGLVAVTQANTPPAAEHGFDFTVMASSTVNPVQLLLGRDYYRAKAVIVVADQPVILARTREDAMAAANTAQGDPIAPASATAQGAVTDPGAGGIIASITSTKLSTGSYAISGSVYLDGTITSADADNFKLVASGATVATLNCPGVINTPAPFGPIVITFPFPPGPSNVSVQAVAAASGAAAKYHAQLTATPAGPAPVATAGQTPTGAYLPAGTVLTVDNCDELWLAAFSPILGRVAVLVSRTAEPVDAAELAAESVSADDDL
jgi:hypothetical protein